MRSASPIEWKDTDDPLRRIVMPDVRELDKNRFCRSRIT
jgi:L-lysine 2,3-aminomutase